MLKALLQGKWLGHPLHPALVHLPVGAWTGALIFDLCSIASIGGNSAVLASFACIVIGIVVALAAAPTGLADWWEIKPEKPAYKIGLWHMSMNVLVLILFIANTGVTYYYVVSASNGGGEGGNSAQASVVPSATKSGRTNARSTGIM